MKALILVAGLFALSTQTAQAENWFTGIALSKQGALRGLEAEAGYRKTWDNVGINFSPLNLFVYSKNGSRYSDRTTYYQVDSIQVSDRTRCYDTHSKQNVDYDLCRSTIRNSVVLSGDYKINSVLYLGVGARIAKESEGFAYAKIQLRDKVGVFVRAGTNYQSLGVTLDF
jgi:hypothetical protein